MEKTEKNFLMKDFLFVIFWKNSNVSIFQEFARKIRFLHTLKISRKKKFKTFFFKFLDFFLFFSIGRIL